MATATPACASAFDMAAPMPRDPPVTSAVCPRSVAFVIETPDFCRAMARTSINMSPDPGCNAPPSASCVASSTALDCACGQAGDDLALGEHGQQQYREGDDERGRREWTPAQLIERNHVVHGDGQGARLPPGEHDAEYEIIPGKYHREDEGNRKARPSDRQRHMPEHLPAGCAVDQRRLFKLERRGFEIADHDPDHDRHRHHEVNDDLRHQRAE